jgi:SAM-dependent methyltransferase
MSVTGNLHGQLVFGRRVRVLAERLAELIPDHARVLDIGCGSGDVARAILARRPDISIEGIDVLVREGTAILVRPFDGSSIPADDASYTVAMMVDVLHHTDDPSILIREAARVASDGVLIKDHYRNNGFDGAVLRFMDWFGNAAHGVRLPYNYLSPAQWSALWSDAKLSIASCVDRLALYPRPFSWLFDRQLHFVAFLRKADPPIPPARYSTL